MTLGCSDPRGSMCTWSETHPVLAAALGHLAPGLCGHAGNTPKESAPEVLLSSALLPSSEVYGLL